MLSFHDYMTELRDMHDKFRLASITNEQKNKILSYMQGLLNVDLYVRNDYFKQLGMLKSGKSMWLCDKNIDSNTIMEMIVELMNRDENYGMDYIIIGLLGLSLTQLNDLLCYMFNSINGDQYSNPIGLEGLFPSSRITNTNTNARKILSALHAMLYDDNESISHKLIDFDKTSMTRLIFRRSVRSLITAMPLSPGSERYPFFKRFNINIPGVRVKNLSVKRMNDDSETIDLEESMKKCKLQDI